MVKKSLLIGMILFLSLVVYAKDGVFMGISREGKRGDIKVEVTVEKNKVTDIAVIEAKEDAVYAMAKITNAIIKENNTNVDVISGASVTSKAFVAAVDDALNKAGLSLKGKLIKPQK
ncbi:MAG: FMN-binding protein [Treponemataceae bacterium]